MSGDLVLVGLMGAGKSTVGELLAAHLGRGFVDLDVAIERSEGYSVAAIFERFGEERFRELERDHLASALGGAAKVIALGGGAFVSPEVRALCEAATATTIYLHVDPKTAAKRIGEAGVASRPLLASGDAEATLSRLYALRDPAYRLADRRVECSGLDPATTVEAVLHAI